MPNYYQLMPFCKPKRTVLEAWRAIFQKYIITLAQITTNHMNFRRLLTCVMVCTLYTSTNHAQLAEYDENRPVGWAVTDGMTTGSNDENPVTVTTMSEFAKAMAGTEKRTIYVKGELTTSKQLSVSGAANKTIYGLPGASLTNTEGRESSTSGILALKDCKNIILRNLTFKGAGAYDVDGNDNLTVTGTDYLWVDHCDFQDGVDGNFDCTNGCDHVAVTWCRFRYLIDPKAGGSGGSSDHRFSNLWGSGDNKEDLDGGKLKTTFANCWWDDGCKDRMARVRFGKVHFVNCLYSSNNASGCVGVGYKAAIYVENCAFTSSATKKKPWKYPSDSGKKTSSFVFTGCVGAEDQKTSNGSWDYFTPSEYYEYSAYDVNDVEKVVSNEETGAGPTLKIKEGDKFTTSVTTLTTGKGDVVETHIYDLTGRRRASMGKGMNIIRQEMSDGSVRIMKVMRR